MQETVAWFTRQKLISVAKFARLRQEDLSFDENVNIGIRGFVNQAWLTLDKLKRPIKAGVDVSGGGKSTAGEGMNAGGSQFPPPSLPLCVCGCAFRSAERGKQAGTGGVRAAYACSSPLYLCCVLMAACVAHESAAKDV